MIGAETERTAKHHRNEDIDSERTPLNYYFKKSDGGLAQAWNNMISLPDGEGRIAPLSDQEGQRARLQGRGEAGALLPRECG